VSIARHSTTSYPCLYGLHRASSVDCAPQSGAGCVGAGHYLSVWTHHIQWGNSLLGAPPALLAPGIPDAGPFTPVAGDDKTVAAALRKAQPAGASRANGADFSHAQHRGAAQPPAASMRSTPCVPRSLAEDARGAATVTHDTRCSAAQRSQALVPAATRRHSTVRSSTMFALAGAFPSFFDPRSDHA